MIEKVKNLVKKVLSDKEMIRYLIIGVLTTVVNYVAYWVCTRLGGADELTANWIAWVAAVAFAYVTNKLYVFESHTSSMKALLIEMFNFVLARVVSLFADQAIIWLMVKKMGLYDMFCKLVSNVVVIAMNYVFSKLVIFKKR